MTKVNKSTQRMVLLAILAAIIVLMAFTPIGYLHVGVIEITFIMIPIVVGAVTLGPSGGAILGAIFGLTSFIQCFGLSAFGSVLFSINPIFTFITCLIPRVLCGYLAGVVFKALSKVDHTKIISHAAACLSGALLNTVFFTATLLLLFGTTDYIKELQGGMNILAFACAFVGTNGLIEAAVCFLAGTAIAKALTKLQSRMN